jgi:hypothetical protein
LNQVKGIFQRFSTQVLPSPAVASIFGNLNWQEAAGLLWILFETNPDLHERILSCLGPNDLRKIIDVRSKDWALPDFRCVDWLVSAHHLFTDSFDARRPVYFNDEKYGSVDYFPASKLPIPKGKFKIEQLAFSPKNDFLAVLSTDDYFGVSTLRSYILAVYAFRDENGCSAGILKHLDHKTCAGRAASIEWSPTGKFLALLLHTNSCSTLAIYGLSELQEGVFSKLDYLHGYPISPLQTAKVWMGCHTLFLCGKFPGRNRYLQLEEVLEPKSSGSLESSKVFVVKELTCPSFYPAGPFFVHHKHPGKIFEFVLCSKESHSSHHILRVLDTWRPGTEPENFALPGLLVDFALAPEGTIAMIVKLRHQPPSCADGVFAGCLLERWVGDFSYCKMNDETLSNAEYAPTNLDFINRNTHFRFFPDSDSERFRKLRAFPPMKSSTPTIDLGSDTDDSNDDDDEEEEEGDSNDDNGGIAVFAKCFVDRSKGLKEKDRKKFLPDWPTFSALMELDLSNPDTPSISVSSAAIRDDLPSPGTGETVEELQLELTAGHGMNVTSSTAQVDQAVYHRRHNITRTVMPCFKSVFHPTRPLSAVLNIQHAPDAIRMLFHEEASQEFKSEYGDHPCGAYRAPLAVSRRLKSYQDWAESEEEIKQCIMLDKP